MFISGKTQRSFEEDGKLALAEQEKRRTAYEREGEADRDPETGERPGVAERVKGTVEHAAEGIASHLPHPKG
jgi:hypothetical protein